MQKKTEEMQSTARKLKAVPAKEQRNKLLEKLIRKQGTSNNFQKDRA